MHGAETAQVTPVRGVDRYSRFVRLRPYRIDLPGAADAYIVMHTFDPAPHAPAALVKPQDRVSQYAGCRQQSPVGSKGEVQGTDQAGIDLRPTAESAHELPLRGKLGDSAPVQRALGHVVMGDEQVPRRKASLSGMGRRNDDTARDPHLLLPEAAHDVSRAIQSADNTLLLVNLLVAGNIPGRQAADAQQQQAELHQGPQPDRLQRAVNVPAMMTEGIKAGKIAARIHRPKLQELNCLFLQVA